MTFSQSILNSCRGIQRSWTRLADSAFGSAFPGAQDEMSRGEFTSAFISERGLKFLAPGSKPDRSNG
jgi:hypothetical protein